MTQRSNYQEITTLEGLGFWLFYAEGYRIGGPFANGLGIGLTRSDSGGCYGLLSESLVAKMVEKGWLHVDPHRAPSVNLTPQGRKHILILYAQSLTPQSLTAT